MPSDATPPTPAELAEWGRKYDALHATTPPCEWHHSVTDLWACVTTKENGHGRVVCNSNSCQPELVRADMAFIALAHNAFPRLLAAAEKLDDIMREADANEGQVSMERMTGIVTFYRQKADALRDENARLRADLAEKDDKLRSFADRIAGQSEALSRRAERPLRIRASPPLMDDDTIEGLRLDAEISEAMESRDGREKGGAGA